MKYRNPDKQAQAASQNIHNNQKRRRLEKIAQRKMRPLSDSEFEAVVAEGIEAAEDDIVEKVAAEAAKMRKEFEND